MHGHLLTFALVGAALIATSTGGCGSSSGNSGAHSGSSSGSTSSGSSGSGEGGAGDAGSSGSTASGIVGGNSFAAQDAIFTTASAKGFIFNGSSTIVSIESAAGACAAQQAGKAAPSTLDVDMALAVVDASGGAKPISAPGTYQVTMSAPGSAGLFAEVFFEPLCKMASTVALTQATAGSVTVTTVDASHVAGTVDLSFGSDHVTGSFEASSCSAFDVNRTFC